MIQVEDIILSGTYNFVSHIPHTEMIPSILIEISGNEVKFQSISTPHYYIGANLENYGDIWHLT